MASPPPADGQPQILKLWPTQFPRVRLPGTEMANPALSAVIMERNAEIDDMTVGYTADNLFTMDHPAVQWLRQCCDRAILDYAAEAGIVISSNGAFRVGAM